MPESFPELDRLVLILLKKPEWSIKINGHTDDVGSEQYNLRLSENRAKIVGNYLAAKGIDAARIITQGFGERVPLINGNDESARTINRSVEIEFSGESTN